MAATTLHANLRTDLLGLLGPLSKKRQTELKKHKGSGPLKPLDADDLRKQVDAVWSKNHDEGPSSRRQDVLRATMDLVGRDLALRPVVTGELAEPEYGASERERAAFLTALQDRLDVALTLYEAVYATNDAPQLEPGAVFIPLLEEFVELLSVETWHAFFAYFETRAKRFTKDMPSSKGKALTLLRTINTFLRILSNTPEDLQLRGRVQLFASRAISVSDKSAVNIRGEYSGIQTKWEDPLPVPAAEGADGDVEMNGDANPAQEGSEDEKFYQTLWGLQRYFAHPPNLDGPATGEPKQTPFERFRDETQFVLERLFAETTKERETETPKVHREADAETEVVFPRYLTPRRLLSHELADTSFRRQILTQYFILFQFLLNLQPGLANKQQFTGGMPKSFVVDKDAATWITSTISKIRNELQRIDAMDGLPFEETVAPMMNRERRYAQWKNDGCPEADWAIVPVPPTEGKATARKWERQSKPPRPWPYKQGTPTLTRLAETSYKGLGDFKKKRRQTVFELEEEYRKLDAEEEDDKAMGRTPPENITRRKETIRWLALRQARDTHPRVVAAMGSYDLATLVKLMHDFDARQAAARARGQGEAEATAEAAAEVEAETEVAPETEAVSEAEVVADAEVETEDAAEAGAAEPAPAATGADTPMEVQEDATPADEAEAEAQPANESEPAAAEEPAAEQAPATEATGDVEMADASAPAEEEAEDEGDLGEAE